jgi:hypothetical protein
MSTPTTPPTLTTTAPQVDLDKFFPNTGARLPSPIFFSLGTLERLEIGTGMDLSEIGRRLNAMSGTDAEGKPKATPAAFSISFIRKFVQAAVGTSIDFVQPAQVIPIFNALVGGFSEAIKQMTPPEAKGETPPGNSSAGSAPGLE